MLLVPLLALAPLTHARDVQAQSSHLGTFVVTTPAQPSGGTKCHVVFRTAAHRESALFDVDDCDTTTFGLTAAERLGTLLLPASAPDGTEFHVFTISTARGGNACEGDDVYVVALAPGHAWASPNLGGCVTIDSAEVESGAQLSRSATPIKT